MSFKIAKDTLGSREVNAAKNECFIEGPDTDYGPGPKLRGYGETSANIYLPYFYATQKYMRMPNFNSYPVRNYSFHEKKYPFRTDGGRDQKVVFKQATEILKMYHTLLLSLFCGFGKTMTAIRLACIYKYKVAVLVHRDKLSEQWAESLEKFTNARYQIVDTTGILDPDADFYIFNIAMVHKIWDKENKCWRHRLLGGYKDIGLLIVDEAHIAGAPVMAKAFLYFTPIICIALTATPRRRDGMDAILELYFGDYGKTQIVRKSESPFVVYRVSTNVRPPVLKNSRGRKDWTEVMKYLTNNVSRNEIILSLIKKYSDRNILLLSKLTDHCHELADLIRKEKITATVMVGTDKKYDASATVLLSTYSKLGVGFDDTRLNMLILACSVKDVEQYAGRLRYKEGSDRLIFDLVDADSNCELHWKERKDWYISRNGTIKYYYRQFPKEKIVRKEVKKRLAKKRD